MYKILYKSEQENVGIDLWYKNGKSKDPSIIFATGRHGKESKVSPGFRSTCADDNPAVSGGTERRMIPTPYIINNINSNPELLQDDNKNIISGYFSAVSIYKNLILFSGNKAKLIEHSRLYKISPTTNICTLLHTFVLDNNFSARNGLVKDKIVVLGGTNGQVIIYNFDSKYNIISSKILNVSYKENVVVGLCLNNNILSVGVRIPSFELNYIEDKDGNKICYPINTKFAKSAIINLDGNDIKYFTTNMQCTSIYHNNDYIICIGSGQKEYYSRCFYIPIKEDKSFGKKVILAICDGRSFIVINNNLFILCVTNKHIYIENFTSKDRKYYYIDNICPPCRGCVLYKNNKIIISSIRGESYILDLSKIKK
jgi:hypothetical protein